MPGGPAGRREETTICSLLVIASTIIYMAKLPCPAVLQTLKIRPEKFYCNSLQFPQLKCPSILDLFSLPLGGGGCEIFPAKKSAPLFQSRLLFRQLLQRELGFCVQTA